MLPEMSRITKRLIDNLKSPDLGEYVIWDEELKGFGVRIYSSGKKTFFVQYRNNSKRTRKVKIGTYGPITSDQARDEAKKLLGKIAMGEDPSAEREKQKNLPNFNELARDYLNLHAIPKKRTKSVKEDQKMLDKIILPYLGKYLVKEIDAKKIQSLHHKLCKTPYRANRVLSLLSKIFTLAMAWNICEKNPVKGIEKYQEEKKNRWLNPEELHKLWSALEELQHMRQSYAIKLLVLTGARKGEVLNAKWDQFDLERGIWVKPAHLTKQKKLEMLPLSNTALSVLLTLRESFNPYEYLFPNPSMNGPIQDIKRFWKTVITKANLKDVRIHDLRHTYASYLVSSGLSLNIVGKLLGHTQAATTQRYAHLSHETLRDASEVFSSKLSGITKEKDLPSE